MRPNIQVKKELLMKCSLVPRPLLFIYLFFHLCVETIGEPGDEANWSVCHCMCIAACRCYQYSVAIIIVYWTLTSTINIWACAQSNTLALDIFPYQSCSSHEKSISVVFVTWEIHISHVGHMIAISAVLVLNVMHLSMLCPTYPKWGQIGDVVGS